MENKKFKRQDLNKLEEVELLTSTVEQEPTVEVFSPTIEKTHLQKVLKVVRMSLMYLSIGAAFYGVVAYAPKVAEVGIRNDQVNSEFKSVYDNTSSKYADTNNDGVVSSQEMDSFDSAFLTSNGFKVSGEERINLKYGPMPYMKGTFERAQKETITELLKNYQPK
ncbi:hypothetical protein HZA97_01625 [Candidatus Woesearchaeota archaeon]|nr:hypothetical protein [Candidatus Woesearchaeota archaeon]